MKPGKIIKALEQQGFTLVSVRNHVKLRSPEGKLLVMPTTFGEGRGLRNTRAQIRRLGYDITPPKRGRTAAGYV